MEFVLVVPRTDLFADCYPQGFVPFGDGPNLEDFERVVREQGFFVERARAERDPTLKQIIPYTLVTRADGDGSDGDGSGKDRSGLEVLLLKRLAKGGEVRLHDKLSIGVGGHVNPEDAGETEAARARVLEAGTRRELEEELVLSEEPVLRRVGLLNDDSNPVGAVHLGLVQVARVRGPLEIREKDVLEGDFVSPTRLESLLGEGANFETWSARLVEKLSALVHEEGAHRARGRETSSALA